MAVFKRLPYCSGSHRVSAVINNGATETNSANVNLTLSGRRGRYGYLKLSDFSGIPQETYQTKTWKLSDGLGEKPYLLNF